MKCLKEIYIKEGVKIYNYLSCYVEWRVFQRINVSSGSGHTFLCTVIQSASKYYVEYLL
jgi:hypothetical protein